MVEEQKKWKKEISAGGVVYTDARSVPRLKRRGKKQDGPASAKASAGRQIFILLINPRSRDYGPPEDYWTFPKGKQDKEGEDLKQVAVREVREEAGVNAEIEADLGYQKYFRNWPGKEAIKIVTYYLMRYLDGDPADHDQEVAEAKWFALDEAEKMLKFDTDKEIFKKAKKILQNDKFPISNDK